MDKLWIADLQDGRYRNPVLFADYSDPDVIRVGDTYYMTASSFNYTPGLPLLTSPDLVNWTLRGYALPNIPEKRYNLPRHSEGVWAPAIRYQDGWFMIYYGMPDEGIFMVRTKDPFHAWEQPVCVLAGKGLIDPCPYWDENGDACIIHGYARSRIGFKSFLGIFPMNREGTKATGADHLLYNGLATQPTIEGPKAYRRGQWFYLFAPAGGVETGWQTVLRSKSPYGPFEERIVLRQGTSSVNGPHQGAWVETPHGESWFLHFQSLGAYGRILHLQPMKWTQDGWPVIGEPQPSELWGQPCLEHSKPTGVAPSPALSLQASDNFTGPALGLQWQFLGNHYDGFYSLSACPGALRLFALPCEGEPVLWQCAHALSQKLVCPEFTATVELDAQALQPGQQAGLALMGGQYAYLAVRRELSGQTNLVYVLSSGSGASRNETVQAQVSCPSEMDKYILQFSITNQDGQPKAAFSYGATNAPLQPIGEAFVPARHTWVGAKPALFSYSTASRPSCGYVDFRRFQVVTAAEPQS
ncbi:MAG: glycoside hydrolase 43 family protein [Eubacteriales bacterium]|nr:glycoside hydrolase 43 family protein [Eubacteriales bacterium]